jgi:hypothetical protein
MQGQQGSGSEPGRAPPKRKPLRSGEETSAAICGLLQAFFEQQLRLNLRHQEMIERHAQERLFFEDQWRQAMHRIERERLLLEQQWMEREEQRRASEEASAESRDAILTTLLTRLLREDL